MLPVLLARFVISFVFLWFQATVAIDDKFSCPSPQDIHPCECLKVPKATIRCDGISSLASVRLALSGQFYEPLPRLELNDMHTFSLPPYALGDLKVRRLVLKRSNIRSFDNDAFVGQDALQLLLLADDRLEDIPTEALKHLKDLQTLSLPGNLIMRVRDNSLSGLSALRFLALTDNRISEIDRKAFPTSLESLALSKNLLSTFNESLLQLDRLDLLFASDNRLTTVRGQLDNLSHLKSLFLDRNHISDISEGLDGLVSLETLSLSGNRIQRVGADVADLKRLRRLNLSHNYITDLSGIEKLTELEFLDLSGNYLKEVCLAIRSLRKLRDLNLSDVQLRRIEPDCFRSMASSLKYLDLSHNQLTNFDSLLGHSFPALAHLRLDHNRLTSLTYELRVVKHLRLLDISFNHFSSLKAQQLSENRELAEIHLEGNPWKCTEHLAVTLGELERDNVDIHGRPQC